MRQKIFFVLALLCAILAAGSVYFYMESLAHEVKKDVEYTSILVARDYIPGRTVITADMLNNKEVPVSQLHENVLTDEQQVAGAVTKTPFYEGEPFLSPKLASAEELNDGLAYAIEDGKRAVAIEVNEVVGVGNMVLPGDHVDVVGVFEASEEGQEGEVRGQISYTTLVAQNIRILAVGQETVSDSTSIAAATTTLEVSPAQAQELVLATERGTIRLLLRGAADEDTVTLAPFKLDDFR